MHHTRTTSGTRRLALKPHVQVERNEWSLPSIFVRIFPPCDPSLPFPGTVYIRFFLVVSPRLSVNCLSLFQFFSVARVYLYFLSQIIYRAGVANHRLPSPPKQTPQLSLTATEYISLICIISLNLRNGGSHHVYSCAPTVCQLGRASSARPGQISHEHPQSAKR